MVLVSVLCVELWRVVLCYAALWYADDVMYLMCVVLKVLCSLMLSLLSLVVLCYDFCCKESVHD